MITTANSIPPNSDIIQLQIWLSSPLRINTVGYFTGETTGLFFGRLEIHEYRHGKYFCNFFGDFSQFQSKCLERQ